MQMTRYVCYDPKETWITTPKWTMVEFGPIKIKGRKVFRLYGAEEVQFVCVKQADDPESEKFTYMLYSVGFPKPDPEPVIEVVATLNNTKPSGQWSTFNLYIMCRVINGTLQLKQLKMTEYPTMKLTPRCPVSEQAILKNMMKQNTVGKGDPPPKQTKKEALKFLEEL